MLYLTADELAALGRDIEALLERHGDRTEASRPPDSRRVIASYFAFPGRW
jgi:hypothetical protein